MEEKKFIICKGKYGFADRLRLLTACIFYAKKFDRFLYIDWKDQPLSFDFSTFFDLNLSLYELDKKLFFEGDHSDVYPMHWIGNLDKFFPYQQGFNNSLVMENNYDNKVLVFDEAWHPWFPELITDHFILKKNLTDPINYYCKTWGNFIGYHIRLSDQVKADFGYDTNAALKKFDETQNIEIEKLNNFLNNTSQKVFLSTDNSLIKKEFKNHPNVLMQGNEPFKCYDYQLENKLVGIHHGFVPDVNYDALNLESLIDFFLLVFSQKVVTSRGNFSKTADVLKDLPQISKLLTNNSCSY
jgi:hypothetical protein